MPVKKRRTKEKTRDGKFVLGPCKNGWEANMSIMNGISFYWQRYKITTSVVIFSVLGFGGFLTHYWLTTDEIKFKKAEPTSENILDRNLFMSEVYAGAWESPEPEVDQDKKAFIMKELAPEVMGDSVFINGKFYCMKDPYMFIYKVEGKNEILIYDILTGQPFYGEAPFDREIMLQRSNKYKQSK